jgi:hypothetical protein
MCVDDVCLFSMGDLSSRSSHPSGLSGINIHVSLEGERDEFVEGGAGPLTFLISKNTIGIE